jgi:cysteine desulfurase/selenocysteine lyase
VFTSGTTMGINLVADSFVRKHLQRGDEIIITESEHAANVLPWYSLQERYGILVNIISLDKHQRLTIDILKSQVSSKTKFLAFSDVSNVLGTKTDTKKIIEFAHQHGILVLVDAAQSAPHFPLDVVDLDVDFLVFSGHKMCGPTGIGVLFAKHNHLEKMDPYFMGGGMSLKYAKDFSIRLAPIPHRFEAGTQPVAEIIGLGAAVDYLLSIGFDFIHQQEVNLRKRALAGLQAIPFVKVYNPDAEAGIITFNLDGVFPQDAATHYNAHHIAIRSGQHCVRNLVDYLQTDGTLRWSCYFYNTEAEVDAFIEATKKGMDFLDAFFR